MADARRLEIDESAPGARHEHGALDLARRLPALVVAAKRAAASASYGVHGRRRAGVGETFWQFRPFSFGEAASRIDWRRSARDDRVYVREREWESAHTVWLWIDRSPSMNYVSTLAREPKIDRALTLGLAAADLLVRGGERVGLLGLTRPIAHRAVIERFAQSLVEEQRRNLEPADETPPAVALAPRAQALIVSDFLAPLDAIERAVATMASRGASGCLMLIADPIEETFPFVGHTEFLDVDSSAALRFGEAQGVRGDYLSRLAAHREGLSAIARRRGWTFALHRTDRPASEALLALRARLEAQGSASSAGARA